MEKTTVKEMLKRESEYGGFFEWLLFELYLAYLEARKGKQGTRDEAKFELNWFENLVQLRDDIVNEVYAPSPGIAFPIRNPVPREIFAAPFRDRVAHHLLYSLCYDWWDKRFIYDSYSCRIGKGTMFAIFRLAYHIRSVSRNYTVETYIIKLDIEGYFMSIPRDKLYERALWGVERQFADNKRLLRLADFLWQQIIFDDPTASVEIRGAKKDWLLIPPSKSLLCQPEGQGIVIGNVTSQHLSNIYLDQLDRFVEMKLGYKHYGRYVDDFYFIVTKDELPQAKRDIEAIKKFLESLGLRLHPRKIYIQNIWKGAPFLGVVSYPGHIVEGRRFCKNFYKKAAEVGMGLRDISSLVSYFGHGKHYDTTKLEAEIFEKMGWVYRY